MHLALKLITNITCRQYLSNNREVITTWYFVNAQRFQNDVLVCCTHVVNSNALTESEVAYVDAGWRNQISIAYDSLNSKYTT